MGVLDYTNYGYVDESGQPRGYDVEYAQEIAQYAHLSPTFKVFENLSDACVALQSGDIDMFMDCGKTAEREQDFNFSDYPLNMTSAIIYSRTSDTRFTNGQAQDLEGKDVGVLAGADIRTRFLTWCSENGVTANLTEYPDSASLEVALDNGEIDAIASGYKLSDNYRPILYFDPSYSYVMLNSSDTALKSTVDAAMGQMFVEDPFVDQRLTAKYLNVISDTTLELTSSEQTYISQHPVLRVAVVRDDAPYYSVDHGTAQGVIPDYYAVIAGKTGFTIEYVECDSQSDCTETVLDGDADIVGLYGGDSLTANDEGLLRTTVYARQDGVQITRAGWSDEVHTVAAVQRRVPIIELELANAGSEVTVVPYPNNEACYEALESGQVDAIYSSLAIATWQINQHGSSKLSIAAQPAITLDMSGAVSADNYTLCSIINLAADISEPEMQSIISSNSASSNSLSNMIERTPASYIIIFSLVMIALVIGLIVALIMLVRRHRERANILAAATETEQQKIRLEAIAKTTDEKNRFFSTISHDMRTPLNAIIGFSQLAEKEDLSPTVATYLSKIDQSSNLLLELINDTLTISKSYNGKLELHLEPCYDSDIFNSIVIPIRETAAARGVRLICDRSRLREHVIMADRLNIQKIALNLLTNAIRFTPSDKRVWFTMASEPEDSEDPDTLIIVADEGIGMSEDFQKQLFEPFSQEMRRGYEGSGTGLGLSIVKQYVDLMGGTITCESKLNEGTRFTVRLHLEATETAENQVMEPMAPVDLGGRRALLVEDNDLNAEIARKLLENKGMSIVRAENGQAGVEAFSKSEIGFFDVILMDVRMPVMDGLVAASTIRSLDREDAGQVPIIAMTADAFEDDIKHCLDSGMDDHLAKPIDAQRLYLTLGAWIARREAAKR